MTTEQPRIMPFWKVADIALGMAVMGTVGGLIGLTMGSGVILPAIGVGLGLGCVIGYLGGRRFLISILVGAVVSGGLAWLVAGVERVWVGAGAGAAMGGFLGVQISMLLDVRASRKVSGGRGEPAAPQS